MPLKSGNLTHRERAFAKVYGETGDPTYAATKAGYSSPAQRGSQNLQNEAVVAEAQRISIQRLNTFVVPLAIDRHVALLQNPATQGPTLVNAIGLAYKHGLKEKEEADDKPLSELTAAELARRSEKARLRLEAMEREQAERATPVLDIGVVTAASGGVFG